MPNGNIFDISQRASAELFAPYLAGSFGGFALAVSSTWLDPVSRNALESSLSALGYGSDCLLYVSLCSGEASPNNDSARMKNETTQHPPAQASEHQSHEASSDEGELRLDAQALYTLVESFDPLCVIATDAPAARALAEAFHVKQILNAHGRFAGRDVITFSNFSSLMNAPEEKQRAWSLLKKLPKLTE